MAMQVVDVAVQSLGKMKGNITNGMDDILSVVDNLAEGQDSIDNENLAALEKMLLDYASMEHTLKQFTAAVSDVKSQFSELSDSNVKVEAVKELLDDTFKNKVKNKSKSDLQSHDKVLEFRNKLQELGESQEEDEEAGPSSVADQSLGEEELVMTQTEVGTKCPFTQQEMMNPVRNTICGHHYEKRGIDELFSKRKRFRCPLPGCNNKAYIVPDHMVPDQAFKKVLEKQRRANKRKQADSM
ncbi:E3 SUMO-protein ligase NSE2-like isoform X1 [Lytechinus variegatus]|uniref:E3 SUMO-protein ligase NSE2-like isoform X1 n=2 Tax=Lytechinus variegatus TaxID=7654 RepID=UPI001BB205DA|nr:E3 SUMO-protein ligase NSE2-like isoform X1 [Lytechinus variegatus]XP_041477481.1 E3 SUMO-protein ligase NSE2-like isoform X1 [Lytechinus variegatus]